MVDVSKDITATQLPLLGLRTVSGVNAWCVDGSVLDFIDHVVEDVVWKPAEDELEQILQHGLA